ncbi:MAG: glycosyltransferase [Paracoccaceae bacterium]
MRFAVVRTQVPFVHGGAERHAANLCVALRRHGHEAAEVSIPFRWYPGPVLVDHVMAAKLIDLERFEGAPVDAMIGLKFPAWLARHPNRLFWILHQHRQAYDQWDSGHSDLLHEPDGAAIRSMIRAEDRRVLGAPGTAVFANSGNVAARLKRYLGLGATPLYHPPPNAEALRPGAAGDYVLAPGRIGPAKRQGLLVEALAETRALRLVVAGPADDAAYLDRLRERARALGVDDRIEWTGAIDDETMVRLYAGARAVAYVPVDEDYGYVTLEAMLAAKPLVVTTDSGGPLEFVRDGTEGLVVAPEAGALAHAFERLADDPAEAERMGEAGHARYASMAIAWDTVVERLVAAASGRLPAPEGRGGVAEGLAPAIAATPEAASDPRPGPGDASAYASAEPVSGSATSLASNDDPARGEAAASGPDDFADTTPTAEIGITALVAPGSTAAAAPVETTDTGATPGPGAPGDGGTLVPVGDAPSDSAVEDATTAPTAGAPELTPDHDAMLAPEAAVAPDEAEAGAEPALRAPPPVDLDALRASLVPPRPARAPFENVAGLIAAHRFASFDAAGTDAYAMAAYFETHWRRYLATLALIGDEAPGRVMDVGTFPPFLFQALLAQAYPDAVLDGGWEGPEPFAQRVVAASAEGRDFSVSLRPANVERDALPYADESHDLLLAMEILEHLAIDPLHFVVEAARVLAPGGRIVITTPNATSHRGVAKILRGDAPHSFGVFVPTGGAYGRHNREWAPREVAALAEAAGFETERLATADVYDDRIDADAAALLAARGDDFTMRGETILYVGRRPARLGRDVAPPGLYHGDPGAMYARLKLVGHDRATGRARVRVENRSRRHWQPAGPGAVSLYLAWHDASGALVHPFGHLPLGESLAPGAAAEIALQLDNTSSATNGHVVVEVMVPAGRLAGTGRANALSLPCSEAAFLRLVGTA